MANEPLAPPPLEAGNPAPVAEPVRENRITYFSNLIGRLMPDAITASVAMMVALIVIALALGNSVTATMDAYYRGLWMLLPFTMQMTLIILLSGVLSTTPFFKRVVAHLSRLPKTTTQVVVLSVVVNSVLAYLSWGFSVALAPLVTLYFCNEAERKGIGVDFPFMLAAGHAAGSVWQFGLSASAPLLMATPGHFLEATTGVMPLRTTIWSPAAIVMELAFPLVVIATTLLLMPRKPEPLSAYPEAYKLVNSEDVPQLGGATPAGLTAELSYSERLERHSFISIVLAAVLLAWLVYHFAIKHASLDLNSLITVFLFLCVVLHRNVHNFSAALKSSVVSCWPILVIYHLYAGVAGLLQFTTVGPAIAGMVAYVSTRYSFPLFAALTGTVVSMLIPSSGGQWVIQGYVTSIAAQSVGVTAQRGMLALGIGDQMGNLIAPFWFVIIAGIARIEFRRFLGYGLIFAPLWFLLGVLVFTFLPC